MSILSLLVALILIGCCFLAVRAIAAAFHIPPPIVTVIHVVLMILVVVWLLQAFGLLSGGPLLRLQ
jgi:hypothetical protein